MSIPEDPFYNCDLCARNIMHLHKKMYGDSSPLPEPKVEETKTEETVNSDHG